MGPAVLLTLLVTSTSHWYTTDPYLEYKTVNYIDGYTVETCMDAAAEINAGAPANVGNLTAVCIPKLGHNDTPKKK